jgi:signal transduction histidine kinase
MSATASADRAAGRSARWAPFAVDALTGLLLVLLFAWMVADPELRAIPYHLIFLTVIVVYGFRVWSLPVTVGVLTLVILLTGLVWNDQHVHGDLEVAESFEVLLMPAILVAMVWHARRRRAAQRMVEDGLIAEHDRAEAETEFLREAAHALRNPVAVARGHLDLTEGEDDPAEFEACRVAVIAELTRIDRIAGQLLDVAAHPDGDLTDRVRFDGSTIARDTLERWRPVARRRWLLDLDGPALVLAPPDRIGDALDAMVENALKYTVDGEPVRIVCRATQGRVVIGVADAGPGIPEDSRSRVFDRFWRTPAPDGSRGTGLGLAFVATVAEESGGTARATVAAEGGAFVYLVLPSCAPLEDHDAPTVGDTAPLVDRAEMAAPHS